MVNFDGRNETKSLQRVSRGVACSELAGGGAVGVGGENAGRGR